jgi:N-(5-amino-5-carboxypentanoyl)-L-cysteinyl-D-valine synthase
VGLFINTLPLIVDHEAQRHKSVLDAIRDIQQSSIAMNMRSSVELGRLFPGEVIHELFDCLLVLENYAVLDKAKSERLHRELIVETQGTSEKLTYPLALVCVETEDGDVIVTLRYASELFDDETIDDVLDVFQLVFEQLPEKMHGPVSTLEFLGRRQIARLTQWNNSNIDYPQLTLDAIFEQMATDNAEKIAVVYEDAQLTYAELNAMANRVARLLQATIQAEPDLVVALLLEKNIAMFIMILAVWKAGMAYTPIDPSFPRDRIQYILEDTAAVAVLTNRSQSTKVDGVSSYQPVILHVEDALQESERFSDTNLERIVCNTDLAYIYFTSGTTGKPKGVMIEHRGVANLQHSLCKLFQLRERPNEVLLSFSNYTFDHFVEHMTDALLNGQTLLVLNDEMRADSDRLYRYITKYRVTYLSGTPSVISMYDYEQFPSLRRIDCVGEDFSESVFNNIRRGFDGLIING